MTEDTYVDTSERPADAGSAHQPENVQPAPRRHRWKLALAISLSAVLLLVGAVGAWAVSYFTPNVSWYTANSDASEFTIDTAGQLQGLSDLVSGAATDGDGNPIAAVNFAGKTVKLGGNISLLGTTSGNEFYPIGTSTHAFAGTFDGQGHRISNLKITGETASELGWSYIGLFGYCTDASTIENLELEDSCTIDLACTDTNASVSHVGSIVGCTEGAVSNCTSRATVNVSWDDGNSGDERAIGNTAVASYLGGVVGVCDGDLTDTAFSGSVTVDIAANSYYDKANKTNDPIVTTYVGGVAGRSGGTPDGDDADACSGDHSRVGDISGCTNSASVSVTTSGAGGTDRFGEVVESKSEYVGGIAGYAIGNVASCTNSGAILGTSYARAADDTDDEYQAGCEAADGGTECAGGIVGSLRGEKISGYTGTAGGTDGGIKGDGNDPIECADCTNTGTVTALVNVGGIAGKTGSYTTVTRCTNGDAKKVRYDETVGRVVSTRWNKPRTGGIVGYSLADITYCRNHGEVTTTNIGYYVGGIVGDLDYFTTSDGAKVQNPELAACYNTGQVSCTAALRRGAIAGGNGGYIHDCLYLYGTANLSDEVENAAIGDDYGTYARVQIAYPSQASATNNGDADGVVLTGSTADAFLNKQGALDNWQHYWVTNASMNNGYPVLNSEADSSGAIDLSTLGAQVTLTQNASYTTGSNPVPQVQVTVEIAGEERTLIQGADYVVVGDTSALDANGTCKGVTAAGTTPYTCKIRGIGDYYGLSTGCAYGIDKGNFSQCTVAVSEATYTGEAQNTPTVQVFDESGHEVAASNYTFTVNNGEDCIDPSWSDDMYRVVAVASDDSNYYGSAEGRYVINKIDIAKNCDVLGISYEGRYWLYDDEKSKIYEVELEDGATELKYDEATGLYNIKGFEYYQETDGNRTLSRATPKYTDENGATVYGMNVDYTGAQINPEVIGVRWNGQSLDDTWWQVIYGGGSTGTNDALDALALPNVEASTTGKITIVRAGLFTTNYDVIHFDIDSIQVSADDLEIKSNISYYRF